MHYRRILNLFFMLALATLISSCEDRGLIPVNEIPIIKSVDELSLYRPGFHRPGFDSGRCVRSLKGKKSADRQARYWCPRAALICVCPKFISIRPSMDRVVVWLYVYKNERQDAWLGVLVGSSGVFAAGIKESSEEILSHWPAIPDWRMEPEQLKNWRMEPEQQLEDARRRGNCSLIGYRLTIGPTTPVWVRRSSSRTIDEFFNATTGTMFPGSLDLENRPPLFATIETLYSIKGD